jgi:hypothetical protein
MVKETSLNSREDKRTGTFLPNVALSTKFSMDEIAMFNRK